ncbi:hypothetical protein ED733_003867 [Metarhizium rileyi]|uniref:Major facilitator superfamily (MFS) profile domain-containing protein n=1 Tax=Metarhizium rileyi (strain RCEF 4871) TaxID=1649241 RepID=A0A5C6G2R2_METRR|nr:hypothetical protein ED733_003867 [Metarhizium rileyi]
MSETPDLEALNATKQEKDDNSSGEGKTAIEIPFGGDTDAENQAIYNAETSTELISDDEWAAEPSNPLNWPAWRKVMLISCTSSMGFMASAGTSILSPGRTQLMAEFNVSSTVAILPVALYVFALGFGPVIGGPLSETVGRLPIYAFTMPLGSLFALGAGFTDSFGALCFCRFMSGFCWSPVLAVPSASISETFPPKTRGLASAVFILMPFLGPGLGPVMGSFIVSRKDWRWTQWTLIFFAIFCMLQLPFVRETFYPIVKRRVATRKGLKLPPDVPVKAKLSLFARVAVIRPIHMLFAEPIVTFICLYVAVNFGVLFSFFAGVPYTFGLVYHFSLESSGLVFLSIAIGCIVGFLTIIICDIFIYRKKLALFPYLQTPPEYRLYPAMIGSLGLPIGLFCLGIEWACSLLGFFALALLPIPWILFKYGPQIRAKSKYDTVDYRY